MTFEEARTAADAFRGREGLARQNLDSLDDMTNAAAEYRRAKRELVAVRAANAPENALLAATERLAKARLAVKRAIKV